MDETRPDFEEVNSGEELRRWYWLKEELLAHARALNLSGAGSKEEITDRIAHFLDTGERKKPRQRKSSSNFDWANEKLTPDTIITDSYRNGPNVRAFFKQHYGPKFTFNIAFMEWMRTNVGKTLAEAVEVRRQIAAHEKQVKPIIPASNQFNAYTRAFHEANPERSQADARKCWAWKRSRPGHNRYDDADLVALDNH